MDDAEHLDAIQNFPLLKCSIGFLLFWRSVEKWTTVYRAVYFLPMEQWVEKGITQTWENAQPGITSRRHSLVGSLPGFCISSHCTFSVKHYFLAHGFESLIPHFNKVQSSRSICCTVPRNTLAHCFIERQNRKNPVPH